jgi:hypothetical protein
VDGSDNLGRHVNFQSLGPSFMTLFRSTTGEAWNGIMYDLMRDQSNSNCVLNPTYAGVQALRKSTGIPYAAMGCGPGKGITRGFFISFIVIATFVLLNLFVAVIIEGFETSDEEDSKSLSPELLKLFCKTWIKVRTAHAADNAHRIFACMSPAMHLLTTSTALLSLLAVRPRGGIHYRVQGPRETLHGTARSPRLWRQGKQEDDIRLHCIPRAS